MKSKKKRKPVKKQNESATKSSELKCYLFSVIKTVILFLSLFLLGGFICLKSGMAKEKYYFILLAVFIISSFFGAFLYLRKIKANGLVNGALASIPLVIVMIASVLAFGDFELSVKLIVTVITIVISGILGGISGVNIK